MRRSARRRFLCANLRQAGGVGFEGMLRCTQVSDGSMIHFADAGLIQALLHAWVSDVGGRFTGQDGPSSRFAVRKAASWLAPNGIFPHFGRLRARPRQSGGGSNVAPGSFALGRSDSSMVAAGLGFVWDFRPAGSFDCSRRVGSFAFRGQLGSFGFLCAPRTRAGPVRDRKAWPVPAFRGNAIVLRGRGTHRRERSRRRVGTRPCSLREPEWEADTINLADPRKKCQGEVAT
jgi:hypothetical protein